MKMVRVGRLELPASCSQSKRATNCATPGYEVFQLWSNMGSAPVFDQFPARGKTPSALASQSFPGFWRSAARTPASRSQITCATNCATPGYKMIITVVKHVVKAVFRPMALRKWFPLLIVSQRVAGLGFSLMDRDRTLPKQARYQLRYTRIFSFSA